MRGTYSLDHAEFLKARRANVRNRKLFQYADLIQQLRTKGYTSADIAAYLLAVEGLKVNRKSVWAHCRRADARREQLLPSVVGTEPAEARPVEPHPRPSPAKGDVNGLSFGPVCHAQWGESSQAPAPPSAPEEQSRARPAVPPVPEIVDFKLDAQTRAEANAFKARARARARAR